MIEVGFGQAEITPPIGTSLGGFIARENKPSTHVDMPLWVRLLALCYQGDLYLLASYDLLGLGPALEAQIITRLAAGLGAQFSIDRCALVAVHTHSGPSTGLLVGEVTPGPDYFHEIAERTLEAAFQALRTLQPATLFAASRLLPGLTYNRRSLLPDGRVSISQHPDLPVVRCGPLDDRMTVLLWRNPAGKELAGLVHFACHGVAVLSQGIGADIPGALIHRLSEKFNAPCLFMQGAAGDVNPTTVTASLADLQEWVERALAQLDGLDGEFYPVQSEPLWVVRRQVPLAWAQLPAPRDAERNLRILERIAAGDVTSPGVQETIRSFKNTLNMTPQTPLDPNQVHFVALALAETARRTLAAARSPHSLAPLALQLSAWRLGKFALLFIAAEVFAGTGSRLRELRRDLHVLPVSYLSPLVGYLPDQEALALGGYEVDDAWRFYGHPAPFAGGSEAQVLEAVAAML